MTKPIKPSEVIKNKKNSIPSEVFEAFNELITKNFSDGQATVKVNEVVSLILQKKNGLTRQEVFDSGWLDIEDFYCSEGWRVTFDKPAWDEDYEAFYIFKAKSKCLNGFI